MKAIKRIVGSKLFRTILSLLLMYLAFKKVDIQKVLIDLFKAPLWFVLFMIAYGIFSTIFSAYRWATILINKVKIADVFIFLKAVYIGTFYGLFLPTSLGVDLIKWIPISNKYKHLSKSEILGSVLVDRVVGFSAFILVAFSSSIIAKIINFDFPDYLFYLFGALGTGVIIFYCLLYFLDMNKIVAKLPLGNFFKDVVRSLESENKIVIIKAFIISFIAEFVWFLPVWFVSNIFNAGFSILSIFILMPIISLLLILPISIAGGFGGREYLFLFFFSKVGANKENILTVSAFIGVLTIINSLIGGIWSIVDTKNKNDK